MKRIMIICLMVLSAFSCIASDKNINLSPINVKDLDLPEFGIAKVDSSVSGDTIIGKQRRNEAAYYYNSDFDMVTSSQQKSKNLSGNQVFNEQVVKEYQRIMQEELDGNGYKVADLTAANLFEEAETQNDSRFKIGAIIKKCNARTIDDAWGNDVTQFHMEEIEWQVFDRQAKKVFYTASTSGWDKKNGTTVQSPAAAAFRKAFRNFLADKNLVEAVKSQLTQPGKVSP